MLEQAIHADETPCQVHGSIIENKICKDQSNCRQHHIMHPKKV